MVKDLTQLNTMLHYLKHLTASAAPTTTTTTIKYYHHHHSYRPARVDYDVSVWSNHHLRHCAKAIILIIIIIVIIVVWLSGTWLLFSQTSWHWTADWKSRTVARTCETPHGIYGTVDWFWWPDGSGAGRETCRWLHRGNICTWRRPSIQTQYIHFSTNTQPYNTGKEELSFALPPSQSPCCGPLTSRCLSSIGIGCDSQ